jgi:hypothetical protein
MTAEAKTYFAMLLQGMFILIVLRTIMYRMKDVVKWASVLIMLTLIAACKGWFWV